MKRKLSINNTNKIIIWLLTLVMIFSFGRVGYAEVISKEKNETVQAQVTIEKMVGAVNSKNWGEYSNLFTEHRKKILTSYFKAPGESGVINVISAELLEIQLLEEFDTDSTKSFIVGIDYNVSKEDMYYFNGINYRLISLIKEANEWKIAEYEDAALEEYISIDALQKDIAMKATAISHNLTELNSENVLKALKVIDARAKGIIINADGDFLSSNNENIKTEKEAMEFLAVDGNADMKKESMLNEYNSYSSKSVSYVRPTAIEIYRVDEDWGEEAWDFLPYCKNVLPNEWYNSWPTQSLRAGAMAVMQFGAYKVLHPKHPDVGCAVCDSSHCQVHRESSDTTNCNNAINAVANYHYVDQNGRLIETCYAAGSESSAYGHSGRMRQNGTKYWGNQGKTWTWMMDYYYEDSDYNWPITTISRKSW